MSAGDLLRLAVEHVGARPTRARLPQLFMHRGEIAGAHNHVRLLRHLYEPRGPLAASMKVAER